MTDEELQAIRERAESVMGLDPGDDGYTPPQTWAWQMAAEDIPALLEEVERLRGLFTPIFEAHSKARTTQDLYDVLEAVRHARVALGESPE